MEMKGVISKREHSAVLDSADHIEKLEQVNEHWVQEQEIFH